MTEKTTLRIQAMQFALEALRLRVDAKTPGDWDVFEVADQFVTWLNGAPAAERPAEEGR